MSKRVILIFILGFISVDCSNSVMDAYEAKDLGHGYWYEIPSGFPHIYDKNKSTDQGIWDVESYSFNNEFILVLQLSYDEIDEQEKKKDAGNKDPYSIMDFVEEKGIPRFWIISHKQDRVIGPMTLEQYLSKRKELKVPDNLRLKIDLKR